MMTTTAPLYMKLALFDLQCRAKEQLADYEQRLVHASTMLEAEACRAAIKTLRAAIFVSELNYHKGSVQ